MTKDEPDSIYNQEAESLLKKMAQIRKQIKQMHKVLEKCEKDLDNTFIKHNTNSIPVEMGTLVKLTREGGRIEWIVEVE